VEIAMPLFYEKFSFDVKSVHFETAVSDKASQTIRAAFELLY
jgi:hypothetical protein